MLFRSLPADRVEELRRRMNEYAAARLGPDDFIPEVRIDADLALAEITEEKMRALERLEPFGIGNPEPVFAAAGLTVAGEPRVVKEKHLRMMLLEGGRVIKALWWNMAGRAPALARGAVVDAAFTVQEDEFQGLRGWGLELRDVIPR